MAQISKHLRSVIGGGLVFWCQGCKTAHTVWVGEGPGPRWTWNGDAVQPVFGPSVLIQSYRYPNPYEPDTNPEHAEIRRRFEQGAGGHEWMMSHAKWGVRCHTFVGCNGAQPGQIIFLGDCTHALAGTVQPLAELPPFMSRDAE